MSRPRVLCGIETHLWPEVLHELRQVAEVDLLSEVSAGGLQRQIRDAEAYICSLHVRVDREILDAATKLRIIYTPSTGLDHLDMQEIENRGIRLYSIKEEREFLDSITATAELAFALMLAVLRNIPAATAAARQGDWARDRFRGHQVSGKTLGLLGLGRLGNMMIDYGRAFRMNVIGCDTNPHAAAGRCERVDFDTLLRQSDVLSIHIHLNEQNRGLINAAALARMKPTAILINTSRGAIIDETALLHALQSGALAGAGLDVIEGEWRKDLRNHPLVRYAQQHDNLLIVPHIGGITHESQSAAIRFVADRLARLLSD